jgi:hypothetical protein
MAYDLGDLILQEQARTAAQALQENYEAQSGQIAKLTQIVYNKEDISHNRVVIDGCECDIVSYIQYDEDSVTKYHTVYLHPMVSQVQIEEYMDSEVVELYGEHHCYHCDQGWDCCGSWIFSRPRYTFLPDQVILLVKQTGYQNV